MKKILLSIVAIVSMISLAYAMSPVVVAQSTQDPQCGQDSQGKPIYTSIKFPDSLCNGQGATPVTAILILIINFMAAGVVIAVIVGIIFGGFMYTTSSGDPNKAKQGREIIINAIIALLLFAFMYAIANFMVPGGMFTDAGAGSTIRGGYLV